MQKETRNDIASWASQSELSCRQQNSDAFSSMVLCGVLSAQMWFFGCFEYFSPLLLSTKVSYQQRNLGFQ
jgi:hypothetical protein